MDRTTTFLVKIEDVAVAVQAAVDHPASSAIYCARFTIADLGRHALFGLEQTPRCTLRTALAYLKDARDAEMFEGVDAGFGAAHDLLLRFIDQIIATAPCLDCGAAVSHRCSIKSARGGDMLVEWVHDSRVARAAPGVLA